MRSVEEPARSTPVYGSCDVLVIGGGPAGTAAAVAAGRLGADTVLVERYNHLGGLSTGGLVSWIDRMTDWDGNLIVAGVGAELIDRCGPDATLGPSPEIWGSKNPVEAAYWRVRTAALRDTVHWSPTVDPEVLKLVTNDIVRESNVHTLLHCWVVATIVHDNTVEGVIFESKQGRFALTAPVVIDCTGDGDVFAHGRRSVRRRLRRRERTRPPHHELSFRQCRHAPLSGFPDAASDRVQRDHAARLARRHHAAGAPDAVRLGRALPHAEDGGLLRAQRRRPHRGGVRLARRGSQGLGVLPRERARVRTRWILDTASQVGTRHARRLVGAERITIEHWRDDGGYFDSIGLCPGHDADVIRPFRFRTAVWCPSARTVSSLRVATSRPTPSRTRHYARSRSAGRWEKQLASRPRLRSTAASTCATSTSTRCRPNS